MSKKMFIPSTNLRNDLGNIFKSFIVRVGSYYDDVSNDYRLFYGLMGGGCTSFDDLDDYPNEYYEDYESWKKDSSRGHKKGKGNVHDLSKFWDDEEDRKKGKRGKRGKHKRARLIDINSPYSGEEEMMNDEYGIEDTFEDERVIYYYPDYHDSESRFEFNSVKEFKEYCDSMNYTIPSNVESWINYNTVCHCCLDSESLKYGIYEIRAEESYGVLFYEVCGVDELD